MQPKTPLSDHLPILATVPMDDKQSVRILSWNIMGDCDTTNDIGINDKTLDTQHGEFYRYGKVAEFLKQQENVDIIVLQEVTSQAMDGILVAQFSQDWEIVQGRTRDDEPYNMVTLVRKDQFDIKSHTIDYRQNTQSLQLEHKPSGQPIDIHNVWTQFSFKPDWHEAYYRKLLNTKSSPDATSVVIGDTNSRILPINLQPSMRPLGTGVVPTPFKRGYQNANDDLILDHPDGAFMSNSKGNITQVRDVKSLMPVADMCVDKKISDHYPEYYRPFITLDPKHQALKSNKPYSRFFDTIAAIKKAGHPDQHFDGMLTCNPEGKISVALSFSPDRAGNLYNSLENDDALKSQKGICFIGEQAINDHPSALRFCTSDAAGITRLTETLISYLSAKTLAVMELDAQIKTLQKSRYFLWSSSDKLTRLQVLRTKIAKSNGSDPTSILEIIQNWKFEASNGKTNLDVVKTHRNMFRFGFRLATKTSTEITLDYVESLFKP